MTGAVAAAPAADAASKRRLPHRAPTGARRCSLRRRELHGAESRGGSGSDVEAEADDVAVPDFVVAAFLAQGAGGLRARFAPSATKRSQATVSAQMKPRSKSLWMRPPAAGARVPRGALQARASFGPAVKKTIRSRRRNPARTRRASPVSARPRPARNSARSAASASAAISASMAAETTTCPAPRSAASRAARRDAALPSAAESSSTLQAYITGFVVSSCRRRQATASTASGTLRAPGAPPPAPRARVADRKHGAGFGVAAARAFRPRLAPPLEAGENRRASVRSRRPPRRPPGPPVRRHGSPRRLRSSATRGRWRRPRGYARGRRCRVPAAARASVRPAISTKSRCSGATRGERAARATSSSRGSGTGTRPTLGRSCRTGSSPPPPPLPPQGR